MGTLFGIFVFFFSPSVSFYLYLREEDSVRLIYATIEAIE